MSQEEIKRITRNMIRWYRRLGYRGDLAVTITGDGEEIDVSPVFGTYV